MGGAINHRFGLFDEILIKDNHIKTLGGITNTLKTLKGKKINYVGATNVEFDVNGDALGTFLEKEIIKGKFKTRQQR